MSKITIDIPESLLRNIQTLAREEGASVEQFLISAAAEKMAICTADYFRRETSRATREDFKRYLAAVPDRPVPETDALPD